MSQLPATQHQSVPDNLVDVIQGGDLSEDLSELIGENTVKKKRNGRQRTVDEAVKKEKPRKTEELDLSLAPSSRSLEWWRRLSSEYEKST